MYKLYIDDERTPKTDRNWVIARSYEDAILYMELHGIPEYCSFDHDLGTHKTGMDIANWIVEQDLDGKLSIPDSFQFNVHSANIVGAKNIRGLLLSYLYFKFGK